MDDANSLIDAIGQAPDLAALDQLRVSVLGKSGSITALLKSLGKMSPEERTAELARHWLAAGPTHVSRAWRAAADAAEQARRTFSWVEAEQLVAAVVPEGGDRGRVGRPVVTPADRQGHRPRRVGGVPGAEPQPSRRRLLYRGGGAPGRA